MGLRTRLRRPPKGAGGGEGTEKVHGGYLVLLGTWRAGRLLVLPTASPLVLFAVKLRVCISGRCWAGL